MDDRRWLAQAARTIIRHPELYLVAIVQVFRLARTQWWRHRPFLPLPSPAYLRFRLTTMYGGDGSGGFAPEDLVNYLRWCRSLPSR